MSKGAYETAKHAIDEARRRPTKPLNFSKKKLTALPPEIGQLTALQYLNLRDNRFTALPEEIAQLTKLQGTTVIYDGPSNLLRQEARMPSPEADAIPVAIPGVIFSCGLHGLCRTANPSKAFRRGPARF